MKQGYAQLYCNKQGRQHYTFSVRVFDVLGQRIDGQDDDLPAKNRKEAKMLAHAIVQREMKARHISHMTVFVDGVQMI